MKPVDESQAIVVSIICCAYNHANYIRECLDGFVAQKTGFAIEVLIHDDASTDDTAEIIRAYETRYPEIIKPVYQRVNQYSQGVDIFFDILLPKAKGKYIAICEGDDYWTDPLKLQKQVDFLESHPEYSMCFHGAKIQSELKTSFQYPVLENKAYSPKELYDDWIVPTASVVTRRDLPPLKKDPRIINGDIHLILNAACHGMVWGMSDSMSIYRIHGGGITLKRLERPAAFFEKEIAHHVALFELYPQITKKSLNRKLSDVYVNWGGACLRNGRISGLSKLISGFMYSPGNFCKRVFNWMLK